MDLTLPSVTKLRLFGTRVKVSASQLRSLYSFFPSLREIDCASWYRMADDYIAALLGISGPLDTITLAMDQPVPSCFVDVVSHFHRSLRSVQCGIIDETTYAAVKQLPMALHSLAINCEVLSPMSLLSNIQAFPMLLKLKLSGSIVDNTIVKQIVQVCSELETIELELCSIITVSVIPIILGGCRSVKSLILPNVSIDISDGGTVLLSSSLRNLSTKDLHEVIESLPHVVTGLRGRIGWCELDKTSLQLLSSRCGGLLVEIQGCAFAADVQEAEFEAFLKHCTHITTFASGPFHTLNDNMVTMLARYCHHMTSIGFYQSPHITDAGMVKLFDEYRDNKMNMVRLIDCIQLSDAVLYRLLDYFHHLSFVTIHGNAMTQEATAEVLRKLMG